MLTGGNTVLHFHLRENQSHRQGIKGMAEFDLRRAEVLEKARELIRRWRCIPSPHVSKRIGELLEKKMEGADETGDIEIIAPNFANLLKVVKNPSSRAIDMGEDNNFWTLTVEGVDEMGEPMHVFLMVPKRDKDVLRLVDFLTTRPWRE
jgi:hypothetical protein